MKHILKNAMFLLKYAIKKCSFLFVTTTVRYVFAAFLPLINVVGIGIVVDALMNRRSKEEILSTVFTYLLFQLSISLFSEIFAFIDNCAVRKASDITQTDYMRDAIFINYHYAQDGKILDLKKKSMKAHPVWLLRDLGILLKYVVQFAGIAYLFASTSPLFILILLINSAVSIALSFRRQKLDFEFQNARVPEDRKLDYLYKTMSDYTYAKEVRINQADRFVQGKYQNILIQQIQKLKRFLHRSVGIGMVQVSFVVIQTAVTYLYFTYQVSRGSISIAEYTVLLGATTLLSSILLGFFEHLGKIKITLDYTDLFRLYREYIEKNSYIAKEHPAKPLGMVPAVPRITFENVSFTYPDQERPIFRNVSFEVKPGEKIGIVGLNGSGKTTLVKLLCRLYDPTEGRILLNGTDITSIPYEEYSKMISVVFQDFFLFAYSVRENILFDAELDEKMLEKSIRQSGLEEKISSLPNGIETSVYKKLDSSGIELSGGERQKLAILRAVYKDAPILILDEPTANLDAETEAEIYSDFFKISSDKTTIFISHRLAASSVADHIAVFSKGKIIEYGNHHELMLLDGTYAEMYRKQSSFYIA